MRDHTHRLAQVLRRARGSDEGNLVEGPAERRALPLRQQSGNRLKAIWWDRTGYCLLYKRLERGVFRFPSAMRPGDTAVSIDSSEFAKILEGLDLAKMEGAIGVVTAKKSLESASPLP